jgi:hypothetical protein
VHSPVDTSQWTKPIYIDTKYVIWKLNEKL